MDNKRLLIILAACTGLLLVPAIAMQFSSEVQWNAFDFIVAGILLYGSGFAFEFLARKGKTGAYRAGAFLAVISSLLLVWVNLAVGLIGNENNPANLMYFGVLALGIVGTIFARFEAKKMAKVLFTMAIAQALVPVVAYVFWQPQISTGVAEAMGASLLFAILFFFSGYLFRHADKAPELKAKSAAL